MRLFSKGHRKIGSRKRRILIIEVLEDRSLMSVYTPAQIAHAYGFDQIGLDGHGQKIAIVDAYDAPKIFSDAQSFQNNPLGMNNSAVDVHSFLSVAYASGSKPAYNSSWSQEATLDVQWAHAMAPGADILLVEAASNSFADLFAGVDYAVKQGASVVSMSWGSNEFASESSFDSHFNVPGVSFVASSGDVGGMVYYPAASPYVLSVGGTSLNSIGPPPSESAWNSSGGGVSAVESRPTYQDGVSNNGHRSTPDVAYNANPNTGVYVYWTGATSSSGNWYSFGGTSAGAPQWSAIVAIANQARVNASGSPLSGGAELLPTLYNNPGDFNDVTSGRAGVGRRANFAEPGYDLATGLGTPNVPAVVSHLATASASAAPIDTGGTSTGGGHGNHHVVTVTSPTDTSDGTQAAIVAAFNARGAGPSIFATEAVSVINRSDLAARLPDVANRPLNVLLAMGSSAEVFDGGEATSPQAFGVGTPSNQENSAPVAWLTFTRDAAYQGASEIRVEYDIVPNGNVISRGGQSRPTSASSAPVVVASDATEAVPGVVARTVSKVLWFVGAALFFAQGCAFARAREIANEEEAKKRRVA